jgi:PIN domain nuclease of toxin-antitoxin system
MAQAAASGKILIHSTPSEWLRHLVTESRLALRELTADIAAVAAFLPPSFPSDPFDRVIAATAIVDRAPLVTADARIQQSGVVATIW